MSSGVTEEQRSAAEPRPLMKQRVNDSVRLIGQVCPGLWLPAFEVSGEAPPAPRHPSCSRSATAAAAATTSTTTSTTTTTTTTTLRHLRPAATAVRPAPGP
ncbi:hypothetical protein CRUP_030094 [Coryphaenoides rupestris]|nr:hypothetical protein CRUP_030094 [Coryphaenoides rupestris]